MAAIRDSHKSTTRARTTTWGATCFLTLYGDPSASQCWRGKTEHGRHKMHEVRRHKMHVDNFRFINARLTNRHKMHVA